MIKGGADQSTIFHTVRRMVAEKGMTIQQAIVEVEAILHGKLPEDIKDRIWQECQ